MKLKDLSILLILFGGAIILSSLLGFYNLLTPLYVKSPDWVFQVSQEIAGIIILPVFGVLTILIGLNFSGLIKNKKFIISTRAVLGTVCFVIFCFLSINSAFYGISMNAARNNSIEYLKMQSSEAKQRLASVYNNNKNEIPVAEYKVALEEINDDLIARINYVNVNHIKINIKTLLTLLTFTFVYLITSIKIFSLDKLFFKKRKIQYEKIKI